MEIGINMKNNLILFGYGTLRTDIHSGNAVDQYKAKSLGFGYIKGELFQIRNKYGTWAGVKEVNNENKTYGEIFELPDEKLWDTIDYREQTEKYSNPPFYYRKLVDITLENGKKIEGFVYFAGDKQTDWLQFVKHGDWKKFLEENNK